MFPLLSVALAGPWPAIDVVPGPAHPHDAAVVVGIESYLLVDEVPGARSNAEDWYRWLVKGRGLSPAKVHLLRDTEASRERIEAQVARAAEEAGEDGTLWVVFIGHGAPSPTGEDGVLVGMDAVADPDSLYARSVPRSRLLELTDDSAAAHRVLVLDTCFSGQSGGGALLKGLQPLIPSYALATPGATTVLTAGAADQFAGPLPGGGRPAFSYLVLGALTGWGDGNGDGTVTASEAMSYASEALAATVVGRTQTPELHGPDLALGAGSALGPDLTDIVLGRAPPRPVPTLEVDEAARLRAHQEAQAVAAQRERQRLEALEAEARQALSQAREALLAEAAAEWKALAVAPDRTDVLAFVTRYGAASVSVGDDVVPVAVPQVREARAWLEGTASTEPPPPWMLEDATFAPLLLWQPMTGWREGLAAEPDRVWLPYQWLAGRTVDAPSPRSADAIADAAAYASAWARTADTQRRRELAFALRGLLLEQRDAYRAAHPVPPLPPWLADRRALQAEHRGLELLTGAVAELTERAETQDACGKFVRKLDDLPAVDPTTFEEVFATTAKLAPKVHRCVGGI